ncbi:hypothetical protein ABZP36_035945 [Zizania latifolia]
METPRPRSPPPPPLPPPVLFKPTIPPSPPPPFLSPSHDLSFAFSLSSPPPPPPVHHCALPLAAAAADMSRTPLGRVGSDLSHNNYAKASHHRQTASSNGSGSKERDREDKAKNKASSPFFSSLGSSWRSGESRDTASAAAGKAEEAKRKVKAKRGLDVGQWVKKYMASMVDHFIASFSRHGERESRREQRRRPQSFSARGASASALREQERWRRRRRGQLSSAPASLRASPANSGHLSVGGSVKVSTSSEESTMEELQSAIEAAIAHCKNSIASAAK